MTTEMQITIDLIAASIFELEGLVATLENAREFERLSPAVSKLAQEFKRLTDELAKP